MISAPTYNMVAVNARIIELNKLLEKRTSMMCFVCSKEIDNDSAAEVYSSESGMCKPCNVAYTLWSIAQGVDPSTGEFFEKKGEVKN